MGELNLQQKLKLPSHVMLFHCDQCGECCTNKWRITGDAQSFDKLYKKLGELGRQEELHDTILHDKDTLQIRFLENGKCPYLSDNNLCAIQLEFGGEYLLDICKTYPRNIFVSPHALEFSLFLTCKTAIKTLQQGPIRMIETTWPIEDKKSIPFSFIPPTTLRQYFPDQSPLGDAQLPYCLLEDRFIKLLQDHKHSVSQRLTALGHVLSRLLPRNSSQICGDTSQYFESILSDNQYFYAEPDLKRHLDHFFLVSNIFLKKFPSLAASQLLRSVLLALSSGKSHQIEQRDGIVYPKVEPPLPRDYQRMLEQYYEPSLSTVEPIVENYMVNYILSKHFYLKPLHFAYYRMAFLFAAVTAFNLGYSILTNQPVTQQTTLQAIYDVENTFYNSWFYSNTSFIQAEQDHLQVIKNGIALANL